jgi:23S rRNA (guanosine2251-2'-O)-methyltransferase
LRIDQARLDGPVALVVGSEGQGMRSLVRDSCDLLVRLPMRGRIESLNAAVAGSIALFAAWQRRGYEGERTVSVD